MYQFILYEAKAAVILAVFYLGFKWLLSTEKLHRLNRIVLMSACLLSLVLPLCVITVHKSVPAPEDLQTELLESIEAVPAAAADGWRHIVTAVYWLGAAFVMAKTISGTVRVLNVIRSSERKTLDGSEVRVSDRKIAPFSWMKWIVMSRTDFESGNRHILEHEKAHIRLGHSRDVLFINVLASFQWFNPAIWLVRRDLRAIHEYEADDAVLRCGANIREYQYSLIRKAVSASGYSITNSFNHSILKNRITMMSKSNASAMRGLRVLYILPLVCGVLALNARTVVDYMPQILSEGENNENLPITQGQTVEEKPSFNGGDIAQFAKWVNENLKYPEEALKAGISGKVTVRFTVCEDGKVANVMIVESAAKALDDEVVRVVSSSPEWKPGKVDGKPVAVTLCFPVVFAAK